MRVAQETSQWERMLARQERAQAAKARKTQRIFLRVGSQVNPAHQRGKGLVKVTRRQKEISKAALLLEAKNIEAKNMESRLDVALERQKVRPCTFYLTGTDLRAVQDSVPLLRLGPAKQNVSPCHYTDFHCPRVHSAEISEANRARLIARRRRMNAAAH